MSSRYRDRGFSSGGNYISLDGFARNDILWEIDFTRFPLSNGLNSGYHTSLLASKGMTFTRASAATVQTSTSTVISTGLGVDAPRVGNAGYGPGLVIEEARTNLNARARDQSGAPWLVGSGDTTTYDYGSVADPFGTNLADRTQHPGGAGYGRYAPISGLTAGTSYTGSLWARATSLALASTSIDIAKAGATGNYTGALGTTWQRLTITRTGETAYQQCPANQPAGAQDLLTDLWQVEAGAFATEAILTTGAAATRAGDLLRVAGSRLVRSGNVSLTSSFVPKGLVTDYSNGFYLACNASNTADVWRRCYAWINNANSRLYVRLNGVDWNPARAIVWSVGDVVDFHVEAGPSGVRAWYRRNGGAVVSVGSSGAVTGTIDSSILWDISGNTASQASSAWLQRIRAYAPGRRPAWAA